MSNDPPNQIEAALLEAAIAAAEIPPMRNVDQATAAITTFLRSMPNNCNFLHDLADRVEAARVARLASRRRN